MTNRFQFDPVAKPAEGPLAEAPQPGRGACGRFVAGHPGGPASEGASPLSPGRRRRLGASR